MAAARIDIRRPLKGYFGIEFAGVSLAGSNTMQVSSSARLAAILLQFLGFSPSPIRCPLQRSRPKISATCLARLVLTFLHRGGSQRRFWLIARVCGRKR